MYSSCIAFLQKPKLSRYIFYISASASTPPSSTAKAQSHAISLYEYLQTEPQRTVTIIHQFKLALKLARAVLQYHSTPWLRDEWDMSQLQLMPSSEKIPEDFPLYLNSRLICSPALKAPAASSADVQMSDRMKSPLSEAERRGIYNTTLFCLGMALLEIGHWSTISEMQEAEFDSNTIDTVRRLANGTAGLGRRYDEVVQKCLRCDFAFGSDLSRKELQRAVYSSVVCPLEELVSKLNDLSI